MWGFIGLCYLCGHGEGTGLDSSGLKDNYQEIPRAGFLAKMEA